MFNLWKVFYCYILFILNFLFQLFRLFTALIKKKFNFDSLMNFIFIILDAAVIFLMISTITETSKAIAAFELDPRSRPPFDIGRAREFQIFLFWAFKILGGFWARNKVFIYQNYLVSIISIETFVRTLHLVVAFSVINSVKRMYHLVSKLMKLVIGWLLFMVPLTIGFGTVGSLFLCDHR